MGKCKKKCCTTKEVVTTVANTLPDVAKIWFDAGYKLTQTEQLINFTPSDWNVAFNKLYGDITDISLLTNGHALVISDTSRYCYTIEVHALITSFYAVNDIDSLQPLFNVILRRNGTVVSYTSQSLANSTNTVLTSAEFQDVVLMEAGDYLDIDFFVQATDSFFFVFPSFEGTTFWGEDNALNGISYATFEVIGRDLTGNCTVTPPTSAP
jgi:hypothetical protein